MLHKNRRFSISDKRQTIAELCEALANQTWCCCAGFLAEGLLILNDAFSEDGAQEFAIFRCACTLAELEAAPRVLEQIESLTCSWMKPPQIYAALMLLAEKDIPTEGSIAYLLLCGSGLIAEEKPTEPSSVVVATSVATLEKSLAWGDGFSDGPQPRWKPMVLGCFTIKTHPSSETCRLCA